MPTNFPTSLDTFTNPAGTDDVSAVLHSEQHSNHNDAIEALEAKVGVNSSAVPTSLDYRVAALEAGAPVAFNDITSGTNTTAAMVMGNGASLAATGTGTIAATSVLNATLATALTVNTGSVTLTGNVANTSALTIGAGAVSVSGANTGDQTSIVGITGTKSQFDTACTDGNFLYTGDASTASFTTIAVSGQSDVAADSISDTLTLVAGSNITITTDASTDSITIASSGGGGAPTGATYVTLSTNGSLTDERVLTAGTGISLTDAGAGSTVTVASTITQYTDEMAQDAVGAMVDSTLVYTDATPLLSRAALTGDVTASAGSNTLTIANDAVTYAKMQNVSATDKILGRSTAGAGDVEEITCTAAGRALLDDADAAAQRTTLGVGAIGQLATLVANVAVNLGDGVNVLTANQTATVEVPFAMTITSWDLFETSDTVTSCSITLDIWKDTYANYPPTVADTITASAKPSISSATKNQSSTLTGWTTSVSAGDILKINVDSVTSAKRVLLVLKGTRAT